MTTIYVPIISPFSLSSPLHEADDSPIKSHHVAYEIATLSRKLDKLIAQYDAKVTLVTDMQAQADSNCTLASKLKAAEKTLLASILPHEIKTLKTRIKNLSADLMLLTHLN